MWSSYTNSRHRTTTLHIDSNVNRSFKEGFRVIREHYYVCVYRIGIRYTTLGRWGATINDGGKSERSDAVTHLLHDA